MKIEYGQVGKKPRYDRHAPKLTLHVGGISEEADENLIRMKFGIFGSIGDVKFLRIKNIGEFIAQKKKMILIYFYSIRRNTRRICG